MHKLYSPETELDLVFLKSLLEAEKIPYFVHNDTYGTMKMGPRIELFNAKTLFVSEYDKEKAYGLVEFYLNNQKYDTEAPSKKSAYSIKSKLRVIIEFLVFSWFIPQGRVWKTNNKISDTKPLD